MGRRGRVRVAALAASFVSLGAAAPVAADADVGFKGHLYTGAGLKNEATSTKAESKLWFNNGWWATMFDRSSNAHHVFRLDRPTQRWIDTRVPADPVPNTRADTLWDPGAGKLYIASHRLSPGANDANPPDVPDPPASATPGRLWRYSYSPATNGYTPDAGFPVAVNTVDSETLTIAKDSTGALWATWTSGDKVWVNRTQGTDTAWGAPYVLATGLNPDDVSAIVAFGGNRIGVMWSNQNSDQFAFAVHDDGAGDGPASWNVQAIPGVASVDDHINLKAASDGRVFAVVKHGYTNPGQPLTDLLVRSSAGSWTAHTVGLVNDRPTRAILLLDEQNRRIHVFATGPTGASDIDGTIYEKTSPMDAIAFPQGTGTPVIHDSTSGDISDPTSTKQNVTSISGLVVMASDETTGFYWHADLPIAAPPGGAGGGGSGGSGSGAGTPSPQAPEPAPAPAATSLVVGSPRRGTVVRGQVRIAVAGSRVRVALGELGPRPTGARRQAGLATLTARRAGVTRFAVRLSRRARALLKRRGSLRLRLTLTVRPPHGPATVLRRTLTWRSVRGHNVERR